MPSYIHNCYIYCPKQKLDQQKEENKRIRASLDSLSQTVESMAQRLNRFEKQQDTGKKRKRKISADIKVKGKGKSPLLYKVHIN